MNRQRSISLCSLVFAWQPSTTLGCAAYARMSIILWYRSAADGSNSVCRAGNNPVSISRPLIQDWRVRLSIKQPVHQILPRIPPRSGYRPCANEAVVVRAGTCPSDRTGPAGISAPALPSGSPGVCWQVPRRARRRCAPPVDSRAVLDVEKKGSVNAARRAD
jgi:hypothetical protein